MNQETKASLQALLDIVRKRLCNFVKKRWKIRHSSKAFNKIPYETDKNVLDPKCEVKLKCNKIALDKFESNTLADPFYQQPLPPLKGLPSSPVPNFNFNSSNLKSNDFLTILRSKRSASSPGINMITYKVYKKCPKIRSYLFKIFQPCIKCSTVPIQWRLASEVFIPKAVPPDPSCIEDFRPIALLNVGGKLFFSLISKRIEDHILVKSKFIDASIQRGCMAEVPGCWDIGMG